MWREVEQCWAQLEGVMMTGWLDEMGGILRHGLTENLSAVDALAGLIEGEEP